LLIAFTFRHYGVTWDEDVRSTYGEYIVRWYASWFHDKSALSYFNLSLQGGFFNVLERLARRVSPFGGFETSHLLNALFGLLGGVGAYRLGKLVGGAAAGFYAALFLMLTPAFYGHSFNNPVDVPAATITVFALYYLLKSLPGLPSVAPGLAVKLGVVIGLGLALRAGAVLLISYVVIAWALWWFTRTLPFSGPAGAKLDFRHAFWRLAAALAIVCGVAYVVMLAWWPAAQVRPFYQPAKALWWASHFEFDFTVFFDGRWISNRHLPRYYVFKWFLITLPEFFFAALAAGAVLSVRVLARERLKAVRDDRTLAIAVLLVAACLPVVYAAVAHPAEYDGTRHYLFILPPLAVLCGLAVARLTARRSAAGIAALAAIAGSLLLTANDMRQLHPHQYVYFNRLFAGGLRKASSLYETDYWGNSYKEGVDWVVTHYAPREPGRRVKVASCSYSLSTSYFLPADRFEYVGSYEKGQAVTSEPEVFLATPRWDCDKRVNGRVVHVVERQGAALLYIKEASRPVQASPVPGATAGFAEARN
jgi:hypothetical protein